jgi:beta-galactosidase
MSSGGRTVLRFDGVYMHADIYINGMKLISHPYGYTTFEVDITDHLATSDSSSSSSIAKNLLAIRVQSSGSNSRWYAGAGIFRHVHIGTVPAVHALTFGGVGVVGESDRPAPPITYFTPPTQRLFDRGEQPLSCTAAQDAIDLATRTATVTVTTAVHNAGKASATATVSAQIIAPSSAGISSLHDTQLSAAMVASAVHATVVPAGQTVNITQKMPVSNAELWGPESPSLYTASITISTAGDAAAAAAAAAAVDVVNVSFGIRHISFDSEHGFRINGQTTKLRGGCVREKHLHSCQSEYIDLT